MNKLLIKKTNFSSETWLKRLAKFSKRNSRPDKTLVCSETRFWPQKEITKGLLLTNVAYTLYYFECVLCYLA